MIKRYNEVIIIKDQDQKKMLALKFKIIDGALYAYNMHEAMENRKMLKVLEINGVNITELLSKIDENNLCNIEELKKYGIDTEKQFVLSLLNDKSIVHFDVLNLKSNYKIFHKEQNEFFYFDKTITNGQLLKTYIECAVKETTLNFFLYYEDLFIEHTNTSLFNLSTPMKSVAINENSTKEELIQYFRYMKACHLGVEYIEHSLKLLLLLEGKDINQIKKIGSDHNLFELFNTIEDEETRNIIIGSIGSFGYFGDDYITNVLNGEPANMVIPHFPKKTIRELNKDLAIIEKHVEGKRLTKRESKRYELIEQQGKYYDAHKYDRVADISKKYFEPLLKLLSDSYVDLRYPEISNKDKYYNLNIILAICITIDEILKMKMESIRLLDLEKQSISEFASKINESEESKIDYEIENNLKDLNRPLTPFERKKMIASNISKYEALTWFLYGIEEFSFNKKINYNISLKEILYKLPMTREKVNKDSNDKSLYNNYLYYQGCHLASEYIEHSLKLILINSGLTYDTIKNKYGHDLKKMYDVLPDEIKSDLKKVTSYFDESYLEKVSNPKSQFRDVIKIKEKQKDEECSQNQQELSDKYFEKILSQISNAFKETRYPDFYNFNLDYKYCLKFLLAFAQELASNIENILDITYLDENINNNWQY